MRRGARPAGSTSSEEKLVAARKKDAAGDEAQPSNATVLAQLTRLEEAMRELTRTGLNEKAILILLAHQTGQSQRVCRDVLHGIHDLRVEYTSG